MIINIGMAVIVVAILILSAGNWGLAAIAALVFAIVALRTGRKRTA